VERGSDVVGVFISEKMSGTVQTARLAADMIRSEFPAARIEVVDSGSNSMEEGFGAIAAAKAAQAGESIERCVAAAQQTLRRSRYLFTPHTLEYLRRGGRIGGASALIGGLLQIRPILTVERGETQTFSKVRTQSRAMAEITRKFAEDIAAYGLVQVIVHYISDRELAEQYAKEQIEPIVGGPVRVIPVSPVIGLHVGPAIAIAYETERDWV
jgi:DegV family protein with EDD domain